MTPRLLAGAAVFVLCACPKAPPTAPAPLGERERLAPMVNEVSAKVEKALHAQEELLWTQWTQGGPLEVSKPFEGQPSLFSAETVQLLERARTLAEVEDPQEARALLHLKLYLVGEHVAQVLAESNEAISNLESSMTFHANDRQHPYRDLNRLLAQERSAFRRKALYVGATASLARLNQTRVRKAELTGPALRALGYNDADQFGLELRRLQDVELRVLVEAVLAGTEPLYKRTLEQLARSEGNLSPSRLTRADLPRLFRSAEADEMFPADLLVSRARNTLSAMGLEPNTAPVKLDVSTQPARGPGALTVAVQVPSDVRVSVKPAGGVREQARLLHELGHALHYAYTRPMRFELAKLGNITVSETYAFLLEDLMADPLWLAEYAGFEPATLGPYLRSMSAQRLYRVRLAAARLAYQLAQLQQPDLEATKLHPMVNQLLMVTRLPEDDARYLVDREEFFHSADDLRAWVLAAQLQAHLKERFGPAWWRNAEAGSFLRSLWTHGNSLSVMDTAQRFGVARLDPAPLTQRLTVGLETPLVEPVVEGVDGGQWIPQPFGSPQQVGGSSEGS